MISPGSRVANLIGYPKFFYGDTLTASPLGAFDIENTPIKLAKVYPRS
ncbi:MAG TPA: hypothetical protein VF691_06345 [Cytophagaceae bacterium]|jgi:hypothetical protein